MLCACVVFNYILLLCECIFATINTMKALLRVCSENVCKIYLIFYSSWKLLCVFISFGIDLRSKAYNSYVIQTPQTMNS